MIRTYTLKDRIVGSTRKNGFLQVVDLGPALYTAYVTDPEFAMDLTGALTVSNEPNGWYRVLFADYDSRRACTEAWPDKIFEGDVSPAKRYLFENDIRLEQPKLAYYDIETDSRVPVRVQAEEALGRILCITVVGCDGREFVWTLDNDSDVAEAKGLVAFWQFVGDYDQLASWNGSEFDDNVVELRSQKLVRKCNAFWEGRRRILKVDQMVCYERHHKAPESGDDKTSKALGAVATSLLGYGKNDFPARLTWEYWAAGGEKRAEMERYCLQDTRLLPAIEEKTGYLALQQTLAEVSYTPADTAGLKPMPQVDGIMLRLAHTRGTHLPSKRKPTPEQQADVYEGAFVLPPQKRGVHRQVHVCDFKSLYPTVIRSLNIGWETKNELGCVAFGTDDPKSPRYGKTLTYGNETESMLSAGCREMMTQRNAWKKKAKANPNDKYAERMDKAYKIACNSIYGVMGSAWSRYYDVELAESITLGAKALALATRKFAEDQGLEVIYMDTDSLFVLGCTVEEFKTFCNRCNTELYPRMLKERGANLAFNVIELDYEKCFEILVFPLSKEGKLVSKRYCGKYLHYAFGKRDKPEIRGLEYMRGDSIRLARHKQKEAIDMILAGATSEQMEAWVIQLRQTIMTQEVVLDDIVQIRGLGKELAEYKATPGHVALAKQLAEDGEDMSAGVRIPFVVLDGWASPKKLLHGEKYAGVFDRAFVWQYQVYPCISRILAGAWADRNWKRWQGKKPAKVAPGQMGLF